MWLPLTELNKGHENKCLRVEFCDGDVAKVQIIEVAPPNKYDKDPDSWGIVYDSISTNHPERVKKGASYWSKLSDIKTFEVLGD